jgi:hypothetical protein
MMIPENKIDISGKFRSQMQPNVQSNYRVQWYDENRTIILCEITDLWSWNGLHTLALTANKLIATVSHDIYTIVNFTSRYCDIPRGVATSNLIRLMQTVMPNEKLVIVIGLNPLISNLTEVARRIADDAEIWDRYRAANSLEDALAQIEAYRQATQATT